MLEFLSNLLLSKSYIPHGHCYLWQPGLVWLHLGSDALIALAYYSIPLMLVYFVRKRRDVPFDWIFLMFGAFIIACGTTHLMAIWTLWHPTYWLSGFLKAITAFVSITTAMLLFPLIPQALALPSPAELEMANVALAKEIDKRKQTEEILSRTLDELEIRIEERTIELAESNASLKAEINERHRVELALRDREQRYRFLADVMPQIVWTAQPNGTLDYYNQRWYDYTEMTFDQTKDWGWQVVLHPNDLQDCLERWTQAISTGEVYETEYRFKRAIDKTYRWHLNRAVPMRDLDRTIVLWVGTSTDIDDHKQIEEQVKASLKEKEVLLKEIHHRVKNNLQIISSLLNLQSDYIQNKQDLELFRLSQNRIESIALIHEKLYQSKDLAQIEFAEYIQELVASLFCSYDVNLSNINLQIDIKPVFLGIDSAIPCGLIINELVLNSLKHAFPGNNSGSISIELYLSDRQEFNLIIGDDGIGFPAEMDFKNTPSLGLQLVNALTNQLGGSIELDTSIGTKFIIVFKE